MQKIISGDFRYVCRVANSFIALGWQVVKQKKWSDGKYTFVLELADV